MKQTNIVRALASVVAIAGLAVAPFAAGAQTPRPGGPPMGGMGRQPMPTNDAEFVRALDAANSAELEMAKYVVNRTQDTAVHQFAQHMIDDHSTAAVKLEAATRGTNLVPVPREDTNRMGMRGITILQGEDGTQRDNDYMRMQVPAHRQALALLNWESENGTNAGLKTLATNLAPTVQQHLQLAQTYLAANNLTPYAPPTTNGGSTSGQNNGTAPSPMPMASASPHP